GQPTPDLAEGLDGPGVREEPLPVAERVRILRARRPDGGQADMRHQGVGPHVARDVRRADLRPVVDGPPLQQDLTRLVEPDAPAGRHPGAAPHVERTALQIDHAGAEIRAVTDEADESSHTRLLSPAGPVKPTTPYTFLCVSVSTGGKRHARA